MGLIICIHGILGYRNDENYLASLAEPGQGSGSGAEIALPIETDRFSL